MVEAGCGCENVGKEVRSRDVCTLKNARLLAIQNFSGSYQIHCTSSSLNGHVGHCTSLSLNGHVGLFMQMFRRFYDSPSLYLTTEMESYLALEQMTERLVRLEHGFLFNHDGGTILLQCT